MAGLQELIRKKLKKGKTLEESAADLEESPETIEAMMEGL